MNEPEPRSTFPTTSNEPTGTDLALDAAEKSTIQRDDAKKDTTPDDTSPAGDSPEQSLAGTNASATESEADSAPDNISAFAENSSGAGEPQFSPNRSDTPDETAGPHATGGASDADAASPASASENAHASDADPDRDASPVPTDDSNAANDASDAARDTEPDAAQDPAPANPAPTTDAVDETAIDALLHQVKVAAGVEDDEPAEDATTSSDADAPDTDADNPAPGITAPIPVAPSRVTSVNSNEVRRVLEQSRATAYASETQRRETLLRQQSDEKRNRTIATALALVLVLALTGFAAYTAWNVVSNQQSQAAWDEAHEPVSTTLSVTMPQVDGVTQGSRIPVSVRGADLDGNAVDETRYMNWDGTGLELVQGSYNLSIPASPIGSDGTLFQVPGEVLSVEVVRDQPDLTGAGTLSFGEIPAADVTDEQISAAKQYAASGGADTTEAALELAALAESKRDAAVAQQRAEQEAQAAAERAQYLVSCDLYEFELPEYWRGKVTVRQDGTTAIVYPTGSPNRLCTVFVRPASETSAGDIGNSLIYQTPLANGDMLVLWAPRWGYLVAEAEKNGTAAEKGYTAEMAQTLVDLQSGGTQTYAAVKADVDAHGSKADSIFAVDDFLNETLVPSIELK